MALDLRNQSRKWITCGNQYLIDLDLNAFGLELFVESYWSIIGRLIEHDDTLSAEKLIKVITYRGMTITLDPTPGLDELTKRENWRQTWE